MLLPLLSRFSHVRLCATPQTAAHQAPLSLGVSRQEHWSGLPSPSPMHESEKWKQSCSVMSNSSRPHGLKPTRLLHPWDFPGKSTGVGCHCLLHICMSHYNTKQKIIIGHRNYTVLCNLTSLVAQTVKHLPTTRETWVRPLGREDPLEKEMATHSCILAWKIPWTEEPGRQQSMGSQRVRHDWATSHTRMQPQKEDSFLVKVIHGGEARGSIKHRYPLY